MPIVDIEMVCKSEADFNAVSARTLADAVGHALNSEAGRTWVRMRYLDHRAYAENETEATHAADLPVFVTILKAHPPAIEALSEEILKITEVVAACVGCSPQRVHVQYAPAAAGRQAFGGKLVE